jgi:hypothetical protein
MKRLGSATTEEWVLVRLASTRETNIYVGPDTGFRAVIGHTSSGGLR